MSTSYQVIDALLFLFTYGSELRPAYFAVAALAVLVGLLAYFHYPRLRIAEKSSFWKKLTLLTAILVVAIVPLLTLQHYKLLTFYPDDLLCDNATVTVLYLPMWVDPTLKPYLGETFQQFSSTCEDLRSRILSAPFGWSRHVTLGVHLLLCFMITALMAFVVANTVSVIKKGRLSDA